MTHALKRQLIELALSATFLTAMGTAGWMLGGMQ